MHKFNRIRQVAPMCPNGRTRCRHLSNDIEPSLYGGDVPYGKLLCLTTFIFGHAHLHSRTDSQELRVEYCIVGIPHNTAQYSRLFVFNKGKTNCLSPGGGTFCAAIDKNELNMYLQNNTALKCVKKICRVVHFVFGRCYRTVVCPVLSFCL